MSDHELIIENDTDLLVLRGELAQDFAMDAITVGQVANPDYKQINNLFKVRGRFLSDPEEKFHQGVSFVLILERKTDQKLFGFFYWERMGKYDGQLHVEPNGKQHGIEDEYAHVFVPVKPFPIIGYEEA